MLTVALQAPSMPDTGQVDASKDSKEVSAQPTLRRGNTEVVEM